MNLEFCEFEIRRGFQEFVSHIKSGLLWSEHLLRAGPPLWVPKKQKALPHPGGARGPCRSPLLYPTPWKPLMWVRPGKGRWRMLGGAWPREAVWGQAATG